MASKKTKSGQHREINPAVTRLSAATPFQVTEAYKTVRTNLLFSLASAQSKVVLVSSALPSEGKSTTCANLAITMAQTAARVLLIDADLRKPTQHKIFKLHNGKGLSRLLVGFDTLTDALHPDVEPGLDVITAGPMPPNPSELLGSENMQVLLDNLKDHYDLILIDTPPVNVVSDALVLAGDTLGVVLVARQKQTTYDELDKALESIKFAKTNVVGVVLVDVKESVKINGYYKSYKSYDYEYGKN
ncbi:MAG: CpsD/CapB family tyrosine-protein kinase [Clostridiales bacterium]|jgi:capsular exopolysaccharide synthesis family protein|nr:CpsD/CapB family tyrosine-protein kinase [Clostridiales bacterium]